MQKFKKDYIYIYIYINLYKDFSIETKKQVFYFSNKCTIIHWS